MSFIINATFHDIGISLLSDNTKPSDILSFYSSMITYLEFEINLFREASSFANLNSKLGRDEVVKSVMKALEYPLPLADHTFPSWALSGYSTSINATSSTPAVIEKKQGVKIVSPASFTAIDTVFNAPKVELECANRLYIENNYFNTTCLTINNRTLTAQELAHISTNSMEKCPIKEMKLALSLNFNSSYGENRIREYIAGQGDNFRDSLLKHATTLERNKAGIVLMLEENFEDFEKCEADFAPKIIDILCSEVVNFDFMSV